MIKKISKSLLRIIKANYHQKIEYDFEIDRKKFTLIKDKFCSLGKVQLNKIIEVFIYHRFAKIWDLFN